MSRVKRCFVKICSNTSVDNPDKLFLIVPYKKERRLRWCQAVGVPVTFKHEVFCCEDHFKFAEDATNWLYYKTIGRRLVLKPHVVPHMNIHEKAINAPEQKQISSSSKKQKLEVLMKLAQSSKRVAHSSTKAIKRSIDKTVHVTVPIIKDGTDPVWENVQVSCAKTRPPVQFSSIYISKTPSFVTDGYSLEVPVLIYEIPSDDVSPASVGPLPGVPSTSTMNPLAISNTFHGDLPASPSKSMPIYPEEIPSPSGIDIPLDFGIGQHLGSTQSDGNPLKECAKIWVKSEIGDHEAQNNDNHLHKCAEIRVKKEVDGHEAQIDGNHLHECAEIWVKSEVGDHEAQSDFNHLRESTEIKVKAEVSDHEAQSENILIKTEVKSEGSNYEAQENGDYLHAEIDIKSEGSDCEDEFFPHVASTQTTDGLSSNTPRKMKYLDEIGRLENEVSSLKTRIIEIKKKMKNPEQGISLEQFCALSFKFCNEELARFINSQVSQLNQKSNDQDGN